MPSSLESTLTPALLTECTGNGKGRLASKSASKPAPVSGPVPVPSVSEGSDRPGVSPASGPVPEPPEGPVLSVSRSISWTICSKILLISSCDLAVSSFPPWLRIPRLPAGLTTPRGCPATVMPTSRPWTSPSFGLDFFSVSSSSLPPDSISIRWERFWSCWESDSNEVRIFSIILWASTVRSFSFSSRPRESRRSETSLISGEDAKAAAARMMPRRRLYWVLSCSRSSSGMPMRSPVYGS